MRLAPRLVGQPAPLARMRQRVFRQPAIVVVGPTAGATVAKATGTPFRTYNVTKTASAAWGNGGAYSGQAFKDNFRLRLRALQTNCGIVAGMTSGDPAADDSFPAIDRGIYFVADGTAGVFEGGGFATTAAAYTTADVFWIDRQAGSLTYRKGAVFETATILRTLSLTTSFKFDCALNDTGGILEVNLV
jgi:hypothetical protein